MDFSLLSGLGRTASQHVWKALAAFVSGIFVFLGGALLLAHLHDFGSRTSAVSSNRGPAGSSQSTAAEADRVGKTQPEVPPTSQTSEPESLTALTEGGAPSDVKTASATQELAAKTSNDLTGRKTGAFSNRYRATSGTTLDVPTKKDLAQQGGGTGGEMGDGVAQGPGSPEAAGLSKLEATALPAHAPSVPAPEPKPVSITLPAETPVQVRVSETLSSKRNRTGEIFRGTLAAPLALDGSVVAEAGATVLGRVVDAHGAGILRPRANLNLELTDVTTTDGRSARIHTTQWYETDFPGKVGKPKAAEATNTFSTTSGNGSGAASNTAAKRNVIVPEGTEIVFRLLEPVSVKGSAAPGR